MRKESKKRVKGKRKEIWKRKNEETGEKRKYKLIHTDKQTDGQTDGQTDTNHSLIWDTILNNYFEYFGI